MGIFLLFIAALASTVKGWAGKKTSRVVLAMPDVMLSNALRMLLCTLIGCGLALLLGGLAVRRETLLCATLYGAMLAAGVVTWLLCVQGNGYLLVAVFGMLGTGVSLLCSVIFFGETVLPLQLLGVALLILASVAMCPHQRGMRLSARDLALLLGNTLATGLVDFSYKLFNGLNTGDTNAVYSFYCNVFAAAFLLLAYLVVCRAQRASHKPAVIRAAFPFTCIMAVTLFINSYARVAAAGMLSAAYFYPVYKGTEIILGALMSAFVLREKPDRGTYCGLGLAFAALLLLRAA